MVDSQKQLFTPHLKVCDIPDIIHPNMSTFASFSKTFSQFPFNAWHISDCILLLEIGVIFSVCMLYLIILFYEPHILLNILYFYMTKCTSQCGMKIFKFMQQLV